MIKGQEELHQIVVYKVEGQSEYKKIQSHHLDEKYRRFSKTFDFCYRKGPGENPGESLLMLSKEEIVNYNFNTNVFNTIYTFQTPLGDQPDYAGFNYD